MGVDHSHRICEEFLINIWVCSMNGYWYIFLIQVYIIKLKPG